MVAEPASIDDRLALAFGRQVMRSLILESQCEALQQQVAELRAQLTTQGDQADPPPGGRG